MQFRPLLRRAVPLVALALTAATLVACAPSKEPPVVAGDCTENWRGYVLPSDHNYAGLGAFTGSDRYMCKPTPQLGIRAHLQHLRNYADADVQPHQLGYPFEPRPKYDEQAFMEFVFKGDAPTWVKLNGRWAVPGTTYGQRILEIYNEMLAYNGLPQLSPQTQIPVWPIEGTGVLTAEQMGAFVQHKDAQASWHWKPEISPQAMAWYYIDEGNAAGVIGEIAFCQAILETGWFAWPNSPEVAPQSVDPVLDGYYELQRSTARN